MRRLIGITCLGFMLALSGCGKEPVDPKPLDTASTSPTPTVSPAPSMPPEASKHTKAGAIAFVRHYVAVLNAALQSGDFDALDQLSEAECESCANFRKAVREVYDAGGTISGGELEPRKVALAPAGFRPDGATVDLVGRLNVQTVSRPGHKAESGKPTTELFTFILRFSQSWTVANYTRNQ